MEGIKEDGSIDEQCQEMTMNDLKAHFRPEFLNRLDEIIMFQATDEDQYPLDY